MTAPYKAGTISVTANSVVVTGTGCDWVTGSPVLAGDTLFVAGASYPIASVDAPAQITLELVYHGTTASGLDYAIAPLPAGVQVAQSIADSMASLNALLSTRLAGFVPIDSTLAGNIYRVAVPGVSSYRADVPVYWRPAGPNPGSAPQLRWGDLQPLKIFKDRTGATFGVNEVNQHGIYLTIYDPTLDSGAGGHIVVGPEGPSGTAGTIIYRLEAPPQSSDYLDGDYVIEVDSSGAFVALYGPKAGGVWPVGIDLSEPAAIQAAAAAASANSAATSLSTLNSSLNSAVAEATQSAASSEAAAHQSEVNAAASESAAANSASEALVSAAGAASSASASHQSANEAASSKDGAIMALQTAQGLANGLLTFDDGFYDFDTGEILDDGYYDLG